MNASPAPHAFRYLLDTNIVSVLLTGREPELALRLLEAGADTVCTSSVVLGELRFGAQAAQRQDVHDRIEELTHRMPILPITSATAATYGTLRAHLQGHGVGMGANDLWIAAQAHSLDLTLVTRNASEFQRVDSLRVECW